MAPRNIGWPPERGQQPALDLDVLHPPGVGRQGHDCGRTLSSVRRTTRLARESMCTRRGALRQIARRAIPLLSLPLVLVQADGAPVGAVKHGVDAEHRLHPVVSCRQRVQARKRIARGTAVQRHRAAGCEAVHVDAKERRAARQIARLQTRLRRLVARHCNIRATGERASGDGGHREEQTKARTEHSAFAARARSRNADAIAAAIARKYSRSRLTRRCEKTPSGQAARSRFV